MTSRSLGTHLSSLQLIPCWRSLRFQNMQCISVHRTLQDCNHFSSFQFRCNWFLADELCTWKILIKIYYLTSFEPHCSALVTYAFQLIHWRALCPEHISAHERRSTYRRSRMQSLNAFLLPGSSCDCLRSSMQPILPLPPFLKQGTTPSNSYSSTQKSAFRGRN